MAELSTDDYDAFIGTVDDNAKQAALDAVLAAARRYCGWHVSPVVEDAELTVDGPGGDRLFLPTKKIVALTSVVEDDIELTSGTDFVASANVPGMLVRKGACWTREYSGITVTFDHGYTEAEAADWRRAILQVTQLWLNTAQRTDPSLKRKKIDDVEYEWFEGVVATSNELAALFAQFRIHPAP